MIFLLVMTTSDIYQLSPTLTMVDSWGIFAVQSYSWELSQLLYQEQHRHTGSNTGRNNNSQTDRR